MISTGWPSRRNTLSTNSPAIDRFRATRDPRIKTSTRDQPGQAKPGHIRDLDKYSAEVRQKKVDFDNRYEADFSELAALGLNSYRFSLSWARLFPRGDMTEPIPPASLSTGM